MKTEKGTNGSGRIARRTFLRYAGAGAASAGLLATAACHKDHKVIPYNGVDIGAGDDGILNFAYVLEQLEAAFYIQVVAAPYTGMSSAELTALTSIRDHEVLHCNFLKAALGANAIVELTPDFSSINFANRSSVLSAAKMFEDTGVAAYIGSAYLIKSSTYLTLAGKIVCVEARHAALVSDLLQAGTFVDASTRGRNGLAFTHTIPEVLALVNPFLKTKVSALSYNYVLS